MKVIHLFLERDGDEGNEGRISGDEERELREALERNSKLLRRSSEWHAVTEEAVRGLGTGACSPGACQEGNWGEMQDIVPLLKELREVNN